MDKSTKVTCYHKTRLLQLNSSLKQDLMKIQIIKDK